MASRNVWKNGGHYYADMQKLCLIKTAWHLGEAEDTESCWP